MTIPQSNPKANYLSHRTAIDAAIARLLESGWYILGEEVSAFEKEFAQAMQSAWSVGVANGTDAIELALRTVGVKGGDGVLTVSHTAVATVSAIARIGAYPIFVDIDPQSYTMCPDSLGAALSTPVGRTAKALIVVHLYGQAADMPSLMRWAHVQGLPVIEDCAQAHGASLNEMAVGTWGDLGCFSFYPTKNLGALGDGGAIIGNNPALETQVRLLREYGWRTRYVSDSLGFNSRLDEIQAAILRAKLPSLHSDNNCRRAIARRYDKNLAGLPLSLPAERVGCHHVYHQYVIKSHARDALRSRLKERGIGTLIHYALAAHQQPAFADKMYRPVSLAKTEEVTGQIVSLPMYPELSESAADSISQSIRECLVDRT